MTRLLDKFAFFTGKAVESVEAMENKKVIEAILIESETVGERTALSCSINFQHRINVAINDALRLNCIEKGDSKHLALIEMRDRVLDLETDYFLSNVKDF